MKADGTARLERAVEALGLPVPVDVRPHGQARRIVLRLGPNGEARLSVPPGASADSVCRFLESRRGWLAERCAAVPVPVPFEPGALVPIEGVERRLRHDGRHRGRLAVRENEAVAGGDVRHFRRRVRDGLIALGTERLGEHVVRLSDRLGRRAARVSVRDTTSRWGSCSSSGTLSFSWRLILAPPEVLSYVVAHEAAHLVHLNHGKEFWALVERLMPDYRTPQTWLKEHGRGLHRYGADRPDGAARMAAMQ